jgi:hypothetical protein
MLERATTFTAFSVRLLRHVHWYAVAKPPWSKRPAALAVSGRPRCGRLGALGGLGDMQGQR